jgi:hypothetical protein
MPLFASRRNRQFAILAGAAFALTMLAAPAAQAFTLQEGTGNATDQGFLYLGTPSAGDSGQTQGFKQEDGMTTYKEGNSTLQFGHRQSFDQQYNTDHMFDPLGHPPGVR